MNDHFGVVADPSFRTSPPELLKLAGLHYFYFTHLTGHQAQYGLSGEKSAGGLRIQLPDGGAAYWSLLERRDQKFARDTERRERKAIQELGPLRFMFDDGAGLTTLLAEKRKQYLRTGKGDWLGMPGRTALLQQLATSRASECRGVLSSLWFGETWAATHFGLMSERTLHYWLPVYNAELSTLAPGRLLLRNVILNAGAAGIKAIDRGMGETQAKNDFPSERQIFSSGAWHRPGVRSLSYRAYQSAKWRFGEPLARILTRAQRGSEPRRTSS
ncbi:MAG: GNAT family N-acetyltransferase [Alphaproteobacteria bacterium]|nr:GNAT family N-acetyltransferase [Alphaproteobacteria bacterium]